MSWRRLALPLVVGFPLLVAMIVFADRASTEAQGKVIRFAITSGSGPVTQAGIRSLDRLVNEHFSNQLSIDFITPDNSATSEFVWKELKAGRFDMAILPAGGITKDVPELVLFEIPFLFDGMGEVLQLQRSDIGQVILASLADHDAFGLGFWNEGMNQLFARKPIRELDDLHDVRMLSFGSPEGIAMMRKLGAAPSSLTGDIVDASDLVAFDAIEAPLTAPSSRLYLAATSSPTGRHITRTNHKPAFSVLVANYTFWDSLSYRTQSTLMDIVNEVQDEVNESVFKETETAMNEFLIEEVSFNNIQDAPLDYTEDRIAALWSSAGESRVREIIRAALDFLRQIRTDQTEGNEREIRGDRAPNAESVTSIPVYYVTDRLEEHPESIEHRYGTKRGPVQYGAAAVDIARRGFGSMPSSACEKQRTKSSGNANVSVSRVDKLNSLTHAIERIRSDLGDKSSDRVLIFVHGYCNSFEDAVIRAGLVSTDIEYDGATIAYSWPSHERLSLYRYDKVDARWSAIHLKMFLESILLGTNLEVDIVSHSMGGLVTFEALKGLDLEAATGNIDTVTFAAPDVDRDMFVDEYENWRPAGGVVTLYASSRDLAMRFSRMYNGHIRAGEAREDGIGDDEIPIDPLDATFVDPTLFAHSYISTSPWILTDVLQLLKFNAPPAGRANVKRHPTAERWYFPGEGGEIP